jgi:diaminopropionate ammonia-lyase
MMIEMEYSLHPEKEPAVDLVLLQSGVGTWASSVAAYYHNRYGSKKPKLVTVEPNESDALMESCRQMNLSKTRAAQDTIMAGLNCGTPSLLAWQILKNAVDLFISIPDSYAVRAMQYLYYPFTKDRQVFAGESGAAGLAGLMALASDESLKEAKKKIGLNRKSRVLVFNTEGVTDPDSFDELIQQEIEI